MRNERLKENERKENDLIVLFWQISMASSPSPPSRIEGAVTIESSKMVDTTERKSSAPPPPTSGSKKNYKGFVAGVFSGIAKLSGMSPYCVVYLLCRIWSVVLLWVVRLI